ncbi:hypothetical protein [Pseudoramibacter alactolyticus]|jgi:hypothetical protein
MLAEPGHFKKVEDILSSNGKLAAFEKDNGPVRGRMMITLGSIPEELDICPKQRKDLHAFIGTFDFYDAAVGIALYTSTREAATGVWITPQTDGADKDWVYLRDRRRRQYG